MVVTNHTFLFADLVGYSAYTAAEGDDRAADMALDFHDRVRRLLAEHLATEVKTIGDAIMFSPGATARSARCAWPSRSCASSAAVPDCSVPSVGVCTGTAVARNADWYGAAVNVAARLCAAAGEGEALACAGTRAAAPELQNLDLVERGPLRLKNIAEPMTAYAWQPRFVKRARRRRRAPSAPPSRERTGTRPRA